MSAESSSESARTRFESARPRRDSADAAPDEARLRERLARDPSDACATELLGVLEARRGNADEATRLFRRAIVLNPNRASAHANLGSVLAGRNLLAEAIEEFRLALALQPDQPEVRCNLGRALRQSGRIDSAVAELERALSARPDLTPAAQELARIHHEAGRVDRAIQILRDAARLRPDHFELHRNLAAALRCNGSFAAAAEALSRAAALRPDDPQIHCELGRALHDAGCRDRAVTAYQCAIKLRPDDAETWHNLAAALRELDRASEAVAALRRATALRSDFPEAMNDLANLLKDDSELDPAIDLYRRAVELRPDFADGWSNLGNILKDIGRLDEGLACFRRALSLKPDPRTAGNLAFSIWLHPDAGPEEIHREHERWNRDHAEPLRRFEPPHDNEPSPDRCLRIGLVSPDLRDHVVGRFLLPLLERHDRSGFEVFCYADVRRPDSMTHALMRHVDLWRTTCDADDAELARQIAADRIDILFDLAMHTRNNRLLVFARKPAPVQATWLAYCGTTGLAAMDWRLTDPHFDPPGENDGCSCERPLRLPRTFWCYRPPDGTPDVGPPPAQSAGQATFGCLGNFRKITPPVRQAWLRILNELPESRLLLHCRRGNHRAETLREFERGGVDPRRIRLIDFLPINEYFRTYSEIDIALDTFPFAGGTTTCDALWMGVPVVSLAGPTTVSRGGRSILSNLGLPRLATESVNEYVRTAIELAGDRAVLIELRAGLRERMIGSPLMDEPRFARDFEEACRSMWRHWCETRRK